jgi:hypothetical protein
MFIAFGETVFSSELRPALQHFAPNVNATTLIAAGTGAVAHIVSPQDLPNVFLAYNKALTSAWVSFSVKTNQTNTSSTWLLVALQQRSFAVLG